MASQPAVEVHVQVKGVDRVAGTLFFHARRTQRSTFQYTADYLARSDAYGLDPALPLSAGSYQSGAETFSAFADAAPDRWGRVLLERRARQLARADGRAPREMLESDFVLGVNDLTRQGAIRFKQEGDNFFSAPPGRAVPTIVSLPELLHAADKVTDDDDTALKILLDAGSASLGGARPKTAVQDDEGLLLAKFPHRSDEWDVMAWEKTALDLAERAGISVPWRRLHQVGKRHILLIRRFDRTGDKRVGYMSARTLLESSDDHSDYSDIAESLELATTEASRDLQELWRRVLFSIFINNTDDRLRNHGLIRVGSGWRLSPIFDINPNPDPAANRLTSILGETCGPSQLEALGELSQQFRLNSSERDRIRTEVRESLASWRQVAATNSLSDQACTKMAGAFALAEK